MTKAELPTPALLLDLDRFERNLQKMAAHVKAVGKKIRPHAKTHKCPEIARRQIAAGAVGVCVAKVGEAEVMATAGVRNLLITTEVVGEEKIGRLLKVLDKSPETLAVVDNAENIRELAGAMGRAGKVLNVLVDVEVGGRRTGVEPGEPALHLGKLVANERSLNLRGLQGYAGHCAHVMGWAATPQGLAQVDAPAHEDAGSLRQARAAGGDRERAARAAPSTSTWSCPGSPSCRRAPTA